MLETNLAVRGLEESASAQRQSAAGRSVSGQLAEELRHDLFGTLHGGAWDGALSGLALFRYGPPIPSPKQPEVREFNERMPKEKVDEVILLKEFGTRSMANMAKNWCGCVPAPLSKDSLSIRTTIGMGLQG